MYLKNTIDNNEFDKLCLICLEKKGIIILCEKCKYKYCYDCANKVNNLCSICNRTKITEQEYFDVDNLDIVQQNITYSNIYFYYPTIPYFFIIWLSIIVNILIGFCFIILILFVRF